MKSKAIRVPLESYLYLQSIMHLQRSGKPLSNKYIEKLTNMFKSHYPKGILLMSGDLGGAVGDPKNSYEEHRWTSWSIEDLKQMLDEKKLSYVDGETVEYFNISL